RRRRQGAEGRLAPRRVRSRATDRRGRVLVRGNAPVSRHGDGQGRARPDRALARIPAHRFEYLGRLRGRDALLNPALAAALALVGFAANSLLCRAAIGGGALDPQTFTMVRIVSGAAMLVLLARGRQGRRNWGSAFALALYAAAFAFAYRGISAG